MLRTYLHKSIKRRRKVKSEGFTIIELLIATTVFSLVLIVFLAAFLKVGQLFYKGVYMSNTQEAARNIIQDISDDIQFYQQAPIVGPNFLCIGQHRYSYVYGVQVGDVSQGAANSHGIVREDIGSGCPTLAAQAVDFSKATPLLDSGMQLNNLNLVCNNKRCNLTLHVVFYGGDNSVLISPSGASPAYSAFDATCSGAASSSQYCAVADYKSTVLQSSI